MVALMKSPLPGCETCTDTCKEQGRATHFISCVHSCKLLTRPSSAAISWFALLLPAGRESKMVGEDNTKNM